jgi:hypothetical protein
MGGILIGPICYPRRQRLVPFGRAFSMKARLFFIHAVPACGVGSDGASLSPPKDSSRRGHPAFAGLVFLR